MSVQVIPWLQNRYLGIAGDWHGQLQWIKISLDTFAGSGIKTIIQLGDFGLMYDIQKLCNKVNKWLVKNDQIVLIAPGNHENYEWINDDTKFIIDEFGIRWVSIYGSTEKSRIGLLPRGFRWNQRGKIMMALGGASSIDFLARKKDKDWWEGENITEAEADGIVLDLDGSHVDVMFTHDAPRDVMAINMHIMRNVDGWTVTEQAYSETSRARLDRVFRVAQPRLLMHGHFHFLVDEEGEFESKFNSRGEWDDSNSEYFSSHIVGLGMHNDPESLAVLDVDKLDTIILSREVFIQTGKPIGERRVFEE